MEGELEERTTHPHHLEYPSSLDVLICEHRDK